MFTQEQINAIVAAITAALKSLPVSEPVVVAPPPPPVDPRVAEIARLEAEIAKLRDPKPRVYSNPAPEPDKYGIPPPPIPDEEVTYTAVGPAKIRIDNPAAPGTPGTRTCPKTGHVLSVPLPNPTSPAEGEGFAAYCLRVHKQAGGTFAQGSAALGALYTGASAKLFADFGGFDWSGNNWHLAADKYFNPRAYMTAAELAADDRAIGGFAERDRLVQERIANEGQQKPRPLPPGPPASDVDVPIGS